MSKLDPNRPRISPELLLRFIRYRRTCTGEWGSLHVVLADDNYSDDMVRGCIEYAETQGDSEGKALAEILLQMSWTQRKKLSRLASWRQEMQEKRA